MPSFSAAQMKEVTETDLSQISAQSGITYVIGNSQFRIAASSYRFSDTDSSPKNWIEFGNVTVDDGSGGYFSMDTPVVYEDFNRVDVSTNSEGLTAVLMNLSTGVQPRTYTVGNFLFCNQDIGSMRFENLRRGASDTLVIAASNDGTCGIKLQYQAEILLDSMVYTYNPENVAPSSLNLSGLHLSQSASGDPSAPSTWTFSGKFLFGDFANAAPATMDVATIEYDNGTVAPSVLYNVPMRGSVRMQDVNFGGNAFGPFAMDGINVHHLRVQVPGF